MPSREGTWYVCITRPSIRRPGFFYDRLPKMKTFYLVRHCATDFTNQQRYCGQTDVALSDRGHRQALHLALRFSGENVSSIYTSSLVRSRSTAQAIADHLVLNPMILSELNEINFGQWEGLTYEEICQRFPLQAEAWNHDFENFIFPKGECMSEFQERITKAWSCVLENASDRSIVVAHGGTLRLLICLLCSIPRSFFFRFKLNPASISILNCYDDDVVIHRLNDTCHLGLDKEML